MTTIKQSNTVKHSSSFQYKLLTRIFFTSSNFSENIFRRRKSHRDKCKLLFRLKTFFSWEQNQCDGCLRQF